LIRVFEVKELIRQQVIAVQQRIKLGDSLELSLAIIMNENQKPEDFSLLDTVAPFQKEFLRFSEVFILTPSEAKGKFDKMTAVASFEIKVQTEKITGAKNKWKIKIFRQKNMEKCPHCKLFFDQESAHECFLSRIQEQKVDVLI
jgi:hypothetical protein